MKNTTMIEFRLMLNGFIDVNLMTKGYALTLKDTYVLVRKFLPVTNNQVRMLVNSRVKEVQV